MATPLVSVLIPVYNGESFLAECLDSILFQDFRDYEVLISDDGSTDGSAALIQRYAARDPRIHAWRNPRNLGIGANFNACLNAARGELLKYVLQDDKFLDPSALRRMVSAIEGDSSVSLVVSSSHVIDAQSRLIRVRNYFGCSGVRDGRKVIARCLSRNINLIGEPSLALFRKRQALRGFDEQMKQLLDLEMWFHLLEQGRFAYLAEALCAFRQHPGQYTEENVRTGVAHGEHLLIAQRYFCRAWMREVSTPLMIFRQMRVLRKAYGRKAAPLIADMAKGLTLRQHVTCWLTYKLSRPPQNLRHWLEKRRFIPARPESDGFLPPIVEG